MTDPYTSRICKHTFSEAILQMCSDNRGGIECPIPGCQKFIRSKIIHTFVINLFDY